MIVTLTTDFGLADYYVAAMKGVILSRDPRIALIDLSHDVPPHDIHAAAFLLGSCYRDFPPGTVHLAVVDPGVGSARRPLAIEGSGYFFVGPDNGLFSRILRDDAGHDAREIDVSNFSKRPQSQTFHGRDVFAPAAAALATGVPISYIGSPVTNLVALPEALNRRTAAGVFEGRIVHIDRFGNCVTSIEADGGVEWSAYEFRLGGKVISEMRNHYAGGTGDGPFVLGGSTGLLEISMNGRSAAVFLGIEVGDTVTAQHKS